LQVQLGELSDEEFTDVISKFPSVYAWIIGFSAEPLTTCEENTWSMPHGRLLSSRGYVLSDLK
jgi:hypothetical protein